MGDLVLRNAHVIDPANSLNEIADVRVSVGKIAAVARNLPEQPGDKAIDLQGLYVTPGIIDMHAHVAHTHIRSELSLHESGCRSTSSQSAKDENTVIFDSGMSSGPSARICANKG